MLCSHSLSLMIQKSTCHEHNAVNNQNTTRTHLDATGIGAVACGRHGCFYPHAVVNFQKGEGSVFYSYFASNIHTFTSLIRSAPRITLHPFTFPPSHLPFAVHNTYTTTTNSMCHISYFILHNPAAYHVTTSTYTHHTAHTKPFYELPCHDECQMSNVDLPDTLNSKRIVLEDSSWLCHTSDVASTPVFAA